MTEGVFSWLAYLTLDMNNMFFPHTSRRLSCNIVVFYLFERGWSVWLFSVLAWLLLRCHTWNGAGCFLQKRRNSKPQDKHMQEYMLVLKHQQIHFTTVRSQSLQVRQLKHFMCWCRLNSHSLRTCLMRKWECVVCVRLAQEHITSPSAVWSCSNRVIRREKHKKIRFKICEVELNESRWQEWTRWIHVTADACDCGKQNVPLQIR